MKGYDKVTAADSSRDRVLVEWPHGVTGSCRLGLRGNVDVTCVEEEVGPFYYRDHLPLLGEVSSTRTHTFASTHTLTYARTPYMI